MRLNWCFLQKGVHLVSHGNPNAHLLLLPCRSFCSVGLLTLLLPLESVYKAGGAMSINVPPAPSAQEARKYVQRLHEVSAASRKVKVGQKKNWGLGSLQKLTKAAGSTQKSPKAAAGLKFEAVRDAAAPLTASAALESSPTGVAPGAQGAAARSAASARAAAPVRDAAALESSPTGATPEAQGAAARSAASARAAAPMRDAAAPLTASAALESSPTGATPEAQRAAAPARKKVSQVVKALGQDAPSEDADTKTVHVRMPRLMHKARHSQSPAVAPFPLGRVTAVAVLTSVIVSAGVSYTLIGDPGGLGIGAAVTDALNAVLAPVIQMGWPL